MALIELARVELPAVPLVRAHTTLADEDLGSHASTMTLYCWDGAYSIEWDVPSLGETEQIGLWFDERKRLTDYDGIVGSLPKQAIKLLRSAGFTVPREFENEGD